MRQGRTYRTGFNSSAVARHPWPEDCGIQGGESGVVFTSGTMSGALSDPKKALQVVVAPETLPHYRTAFFEAFPKNPQSFLRGEGKTLEEAEDACWRQWERIMACPGHEFERGRYRQGQGICRHFGLYGSRVFPSLDRCGICGDEAYGTDRHDAFRCKRHYAEIPEEDKSEMHKRLDRMRAED